MIKVMICIGSGFVFIGVGDQVKTNISIIYYLYNTILITDPSTQRSLYSSVPLLASLRYIFFYLFSRKVTEVLIT